LKEFHAKAFSLAKPIDSFNTFLLAEDAIDVLESILSYSNGIAIGKTTVAFLKFLRIKIESNEIKAFKKDEWTNIFGFLEAHLNDLKEYSEMEAWPVMYDNFVSWARKEQP
jgi:hypothetical protein